MLTPYLTVSAILFAIGALGFLTRRNLIVMFLSAEMMLQGVSLNLIAYGHAWGNWSGPVFAIFVITVAAAEAGIALALVLTLYRRSHTLNVNVLQELREADVPPTMERAMDEDWGRSTAKQPRLTPSGIAPPRTEEEIEEEAAEAAHA